MLNRTIARWRVPIGESGMLDFYLGILPLSGDDKRNLKLQTMRLIGNACADVGGFSSHSWAGA